jgi:hypothetical protein
VAGASMMGVEQDGDLLWAGCDHPCNGDQVAAVPAYASALIFL